MSRDVRCAMARWSFSARLVYGSGSGAGTAATRYAARRSSPMPTKRRITPRRNPSSKRYALYAANTREELAVVPEHYVAAAGSVTELRDHPAWSTRPALIVEQGIGRNVGRIVA